MGSNTKDAGATTPGGIVQNDKTDSATGEKGNPVLPSTSPAKALPVDALSPSASLDPNAKLLSAATKGDSTEVKSLLQQGADINTKDHPDGRTSLHLAARNNHLNVVEALLRHDLDVNIKDVIKSQTPLGIAAAHGLVIIITALLNHQAVDLNTRDINNRTPLHLAVRGGKKLTVDALLKTGKVEINAKDTWGLTPLHLAAREKFGDIVEELLRNQAKLDEVDQDGNSPLHLAARVGSSDIVRTLLLGKAGVNIRNKAEETPLHLAVNPEAKDDAAVSNIVTELLRNGADIDARNKVDKETPLHVAARRGPRSAVEALLSFNNPVAGTDGARADLDSTKPTANVNSENRNKYTPLSIAVRHRRTDIVRLMLERATPPANLSLKGPIENARRTVTALENAVRKGNVEIVKLFLENTPVTREEIDAPFNSDLHCTPLTWAVKEGNWELAETLLKSGAGINVQDRDSLSPLHMASRKGHDEILRHLLQHGPKPNVDLKSKDEWTALHYASSAGHENIAQALLDGQANPCARTKRIKKGGGDTPLSLAVSKSHVKAVRVFLSHLQKDSRDSHREWEGHYLGLEDMDDHEVRYSLNSLNWVAEHEEIHDLVKFVLKQQDFLESRASGHGDDADDKPHVKQKLSHWDRKILDFQRHIDDVVSKGKEEWTALEWAVYRGNLELVERLVVSSNNGSKNQEKAKDMVRKIREKIRERIHQYPEELKKQEEEEEMARYYLGYDPYEGENSEEDSDAKEEPRDTDIESSRGADTSRRHSTASTPTSAEEESRLSVTNWQDFKNKLNEMEENYIDIQDALQHAIPLDPGIVKIADSGKALTVPSLGQTLSEKIDEFFAGIVDIYNDAGSVALLRRSRKVEKVIYEKGPRAIMESARAGVNMSQVLPRKAQPKKAQSTNLKEEDLRLRWVHLPANNTQWIEDLSLRVLLDRSADHMTTVERPNSHLETQEFLRQSWRVLPKGNSQVHFMKPTCVKLITEPKPETTEHAMVEEKQRSESKSDRDDTPRATPMTKQKLRADEPNTLALYMPYFTFSTLTTNELGPQDTPRDVPLSINRQTDPHGRLPIRIARALWHTIRPAQGGGGAPPAEEPPAPDWSPLLSPIQQVGTYQKLIDAYENKIVHGSHTLDEYFYHSVSDEANQRDLKRRNKTQITSKRILDATVNRGYPGDWTIIRVDHLWLWIVDNKTIISTSTHRKDKRPDPILEGIWTHMNSEEVRSGRTSLPPTPYEMAKFITEFCINFFDATCKVGEVEESISEIYKNAINKTSRDEAQLFDKFTKKISKVISSLKAPISQSTVDPEDQAKEQVKSNFTAIREASELLGQIKDIRDELNMLGSVLTQQKSVWNELHGHQAAEHNMRGPAYALNSIDEMDRQAERVQGAVLSILELEQNEASIQEAMTSREQAQQSIRQGRTLMTFTIVTIIFLPGSFLVALFALNIAVFPHSGENVYWPNWVFAVIFGITTVLVAIIIPFALYSDQVKHLVKEFDKKMKHEKSSGTSVV